MTRFAGWSERELLRRERVFDGLLNKATRSVGRVVAANMRAALTAAAAPDDEYVPSGWQPAGGEVATAWAYHVDHELMPYLEDAFLDSAADVHGAAELAAGVSITKVTDELASDYLAAARNRLVGVGDLVWNAIRVELSSGYAAGDGVEQLATRVRKIVDVTEPRARTIARTELISAVNASNLLQVKIAGFTDAECSKCWLATDDERTRIAHHQADGQCVGLWQPFIVGGEGLQFPGDPSGRPDNVINCRCSLGYEFHDDDPLTAAEDFGLDWDPTEHPRNPADGRFVDVVGAVERFIDADEATRMHVAMTKGKPWTKAQDKALEGYVTRTFTPVNGVLRGEQESDERTDQEIANIHAAMRPTTQPIRVSRRVQSTAFGIPPGVGADRDYSGDLQHLVGRTLREPGFLSTSTNERWSKPTLVAGRMIVIELDVPAGTPAAFLGAPGGPGMSHESELLLDHGTKFVVTKVFKEPNGPTRVYGRVVTDTLVAKYDPKELRDDHGRWTDTPGSGAAYKMFDYLADQRDRNDFEREMDDNGPAPTTEQFSELELYADSGYDDINTALRRKRTHGEDPSDDVLNSITLLRDAMRPTPRDVQVRRHVEPDAFGIKTNHQVLLSKHHDWSSELKHLVGRTLEEPGFMSTSVDPNWSSHATYGIMIEVNVPEGTPAYYMGGMDGPGLEGEFELLLNAGTRFKVLDVVHESGRITTVRAEVVS